MKISREVFALPGGEHQKKTTLYNLGQFRFPHQALAIRNVHGMADQNGNLDVSFDVELAALALGLPEDLLRCMIVLEDAFYERLPGPFQPWYLYPHMPLEFTGDGEAVWDMWHSAALWSALLRLVQPGQKVQFNLQHCWDFLLAARNVEIPVESQINRKGDKVSEVMGVVFNISKIPYVDREFSFGSLKEAAVNILDGIDQEASDLPDTKTWYDHRHVLPYLFLKYVQQHCLKN